MLGRSVKIDSSSSNNNKTAVEALEGSEAIIATGGQVATLTRDSRRRRRRRMVTSLHWCACGPTVRRGVDQPGQTTDQAAVSSSQHQASSLWTVDA